LTASFYLPVVSNVGCDGRHQATCRIFPNEPVSQRKDLQVFATAFKGKKKTSRCIADSILHIFHTNPATHIFRD